MMRNLSGHSPVDISSHLKGIDFPANKNDLLKQARKNQADHYVMDTIQEMQDHEFHSMADVMRAYGESYRRNAA